MTPEEIECLLRHYWSPEPFTAQSIGTLKSKGLLKDGAENEYGKKTYLTETGLAYVRALQDMPIPVKKVTWEIPQFSVGSYEAIE